MSTEYRTCDGRTDRRTNGQTSCDGIVRGPRSVYASRGKNEFWKRAVIAYRTWYCLWSRSLSTMRLSRSGGKRWCRQFIGSVILRDDCCWRLSVSDRLGSSSWETWLRTLCACDYLQPSTLDRLSFISTCMRCIEAGVPHGAGTILSVESNQNVESKRKNVESKIAFLLQEISYFEP